MPLGLAGNFAELRRNHFHTGLDIKTGGAEGHKVRSAEAGEVVRIGVSPWGYGKVLYIAHPNGYTTVYAHLQSFSEKIDAVVKAEQYARESYAIDFAPDPPVPVSRAEVVALSGNSGSSGGPHLHFEIRKTATNRPQNPLMYGFDIADHIPPRIRGVRFHPLTDTSLVNGSPTARSLVASGGNGSYQLKSGQSVNVYGAFGLSLHALDFLDGYPNKCGIYSLQLEIDGKVVNRQQFDELDFATSRHINCYKDYEVYHQNGWHYHKSFVEPGNSLEIYPSLPADSGVVFFAEAGTHQVRYTATDAHGNTSIMEFTFESLDRPNGRFAPSEPYDAYFYRNRDNSFEYLDEMHLSLPAGALYNDLKFQFGREMPNTACLSPRYRLQNVSVPLDKAMEVEISMEGIPAHLRGRLIAARYATAGSPQYIAGKADGDWYAIKSKDFGIFCLTADTVAPTLAPNKYSGGGSVSKGSVLGFYISDDKSGVATYTGKLNGQWVLMEYEPKKNLLFLRVGESDFQKGSNELEITIGDKSGNELRRTFTYTY